MIMISYTNIHAYWLYSLIIADVNGDFMTVIYMVRDCYKYGTQLSIVKIL